MEKDQAAAARQKQEPEMKQEIPIRSRMKSVLEGG
jgi:hypothetical protein